MDKILLGMSGGVDSTVAAYLLKQQGYEVVGVTLDLIPGGDGSIGERAKICADTLGIEHRIVDMRDIFKCNVIDNFISEYLAGRTPSPCIECNRHIKFGAMLSLAKDWGMERIATGHYARVEKTGDRYILKKAYCREKDQSYMLYTLNQEQLSKVVFPLQNLTKEEVRAIARDAGLPCADTGDSQEICFIQDDDYIRFLTDNVSTLPPQGNFTDKEGNILGTHLGIHRYTIGQRKGLGIAFGKPMFVTGIDAETNRVILGESGEEYSPSLIAEKINFIPFDRLTEPTEAECKVRYGNKIYKATLYPADGNTVRVEFEDKARAVTPGQSVVFYDGDTVLGGGIIK